MSKQSGVLFQFFVIFSEYFKFTLGVSHITISNPKNANSDFLEYTSN
jgi:hypothetical protein